MGGGNPTFCYIGSGVSITECRFRVLSYSSAAWGWGFIQNGMDAFNSLVNTIKNEYNHTVHLARWYEHNQHIFPIDTLYAFKRRKHILRAIFT